MTHHNTDGGPDASGLETTLALARLLRALETHLVTLCDRVDAYLAALARANRELDEVKRRLDQLEARVRRGSRGGA